MELVLFVILLRDTPVLMMVLSFFVVDVAFLMMSQFNGVVCYRWFVHHAMPCHLRWPEEINALHEKLAQAHKDVGVWKRRCLLADGN